MATYHQRLFSGVIFILMINVFGCAEMVEQDRSNQIFEYRTVGGVPPERVENVLTIAYQGGSCAYKTLDRECCFTIQQEEMRSLFRGVDHFITHYSASKIGFLPDSTISTFRIYNQTSMRGISFYADEYLEQAYPELKRPEEFKRLENILKDMIKKHCG